MKKIISLLAVFAAIMFSLIIFPANTVFADQGSEKMLWSNMNTGAVQNNPPKEKELTLRENAILLTRISTYHWNSGRGAEPGTIYLYEGNKQIGSWKATGRSGSGVNNVHWDAKTNVVLYPDHTYTVKVSDHKSWSWNETSGNCGMFELYGLDPAPDSSSSGGDGFPVSDLSVYYNGKKIPLTDDKGSTLKPIIKDGTVYLPAESLMKTLGQDTKWDKNENAFYIGNVPDEEIPGHCWVLVNTTHDVKKNEQVAEGPFFSHGIGGRVEALLFSPVLAHENGEIGQCAQDGGEISSLDAQDDRVHVGGPLYIQAGQDEGAAQEESRD